MPFSRGLMSRKSIASSIAAAAFGAVAFTSINATTAPEPAHAAGNVGLRVVDLNTRFDLGGDAFKTELAAAKNQNPDVILLQETQWRDSIIKTWASNNGYRLFYGDSDAKQESVVLLKKNGRWDVKSVGYRLGAGATQRASGATMGARYIQTVRVVDNWSGRRMAFSSLHTHPEVQWWPSQANDPGAPNPFQVQPRYGTQTLNAYYGYMSALHDQFVANRSAGFPNSIAAGDFNAGVEYERNWSGFQSQRLNDVASSNHQALGQIPTFVEDSTGQNRSIDYVYKANTSVVSFVRQYPVNVASDHHMIVVDFSVVKR
jgi:endonuclease/exonuclease/phosphatase (EEP) superfamily protein YafD